MLFSKELTLSDDQAITGDAVSTNVLDTGANGTDPHTGVAIEKSPFNGVNVPFLVQVTEDFDALTTLAITVQESDDDTTYTDVIGSTVALADLKAGKLLPIHVAPQGITKRYVRLDYNVTGTNPTVGKITAGIVAAVQTN